MYPAWLKGDCHLFPGGSQYNHFMRKLWNTLKDNRDESIELNVNVYDVVSKSPSKYSATLCISGCTHIWEITVNFWVITRYPVN